jgi:alkylation response protein AidB-like acyl-CoA dehydrogenase
VDATIELDELRDSARRVLDGHVNRQEILKDPATVAAQNRALWKTMSELGWLGLSVPEARGGLGQAFTALAVLYREFGRTLSGTGFASAVIGLDILGQDGATHAAAGLIDAGLNGEALVVSVAAGIGLVTAETHGAKLVLEGKVQGVLAVGEATHLLVPIEDGGPAIVLVDRSAPGVEVTQHSTWDVTRMVYELKFARVEVPSTAVILRGLPATQALARAATHFDLALACDAIGGTEQIFGETLAYMETRRQFNRAIATFQALKHRCADWKTAMEGSRALLEATCESFAARRGEWRSTAAGSRLYASAVYRTVSEDAVQLHGGIGFTWEHPCHLFLKRARLNDALGGTAERRKDAVAPTMLRAASERLGSLLTNRFAS